MPPPPDPTITRSTVEFHVVMHTPLSSANAAEVLAVRTASVDDCYESEVMSACRLAESRGSMPSTSQDAHVPAGGRRAPRRTGIPVRPPTSGLPAGTEVFSADDHISLAEDIFYERFPEAHEGPGAPGHERRRRLDARHRRQVVPAVREFTEVLMQYDPLAGAHTGDVDARLARARVRRHPPGAGVPERDARPCSAGPTRRSASSASASTTSTSPSCRSGRTAASTASASSTGGTPTAPAGRSTELKALGLKTFLLPLKPGQGRRASPSTTTSPRWTACGRPSRRAGLPVSHHIGESAAGVAVPGQQRRASA